MDKPWFESAPELRVDHSLLAAGLRPMPAGTPALQQANPASQTVARRAQTTDAPGIGTFVRESRKCSQVALSIPGNAIGGLITKTLKPAPGYLRGLWITVTASGGTGSAAVYQADAPWSAINSIQLKDAFGTVVYQSDGYGLFLVNIYSGQKGSCGFQNPTSDTQFSTGSTAGNFTFSLFLPLELDNDTGYCSLPAMNAAAQMTIQIQLGTSIQIYSTPPTGAPTITVDIYEEFWAVPLSDPSLTPPDDGSSHQWSQSQGQISVASGANSRIPLPDVGTYLSTLILVFRDATATTARIDGVFAADLELWVDGVPVRIEHPQRLFTRMFMQFGVTRPTGVAVYTFRDSVGRTVDDDNLDLLLPTTPGTLLEVFSGTWGTFSNGPATVQTYTGKLYPVGAVPEHAL